MGRIQFNWNAALEKKGFQIEAIGPLELGSMRHPGLFPFKAKSYFKTLGVQPEIILAHEPVSGAFVKMAKKLVLVSHGIEPRNWELSLQGKIPNPHSKSIRTRLLFPLWRLYWCEKGIKGANKLLLSNSEDADFVQIRYKRKASDILIFKNGHYPELVPKEQRTDRDIPTLWWNSAWIDRKGKDIFIKALEILRDKGLNFRVLITGTGYGQDVVEQDIPERLKSIITVVSRFDLEREKALIMESDIFVLASYFEGLPLSLVQAMASGLCCVVSKNCGQKDIVTHDKTGLLFNTGDEKDLAAQLERVIKEKNLRISLAANASAAIRPWTWEKASEEVVNFIL